MIRLSITRTMARYEVCSLTNVTFITAHQAPIVVHSNEHDLAFSVE
jgi:hypothetical protein